MKLRVVLTALLNVALLAAAFGLFIALQFGEGFDSFLLAGASGRMQTIAREIESELPGTSEALVPALLQQATARHGIELVLAENNGRVVGGGERALPDALLQRLSGGERAGGPPQGPLPAAGRPAGMRPPPSQVFLVRAPSAPRYWAGVRMPVQTSEDTVPRRGTLLFVSNRFFTDPFFVDLRPWAAFTLVVLALSAACWWPLMRRTSREVARAELVAHQRQFLRDTAHELRSPIARMQLGLDLIEAQAQAGAPAVAERVDRVRGDLRDMTVLTDGLIDAARAEAAAQAMPMEAVDVRQVVERAAEMEQRPGGAIDISGVASVRAMGKSDAIVRALANVLRNAVFYASDGGPIVVRTVKRRGEIDVIVEDSGPGVPAAALDRLFTPFYRVDASRARASGGAGLGLAIARAAIESSGGRISCRNRQPHGLEVTVTLGSE